MTTNPSEKILLDARGLQKRFRDSEGDSSLVIDIEELKLARGEQLFLEGGSGMGKTTLLNLLSGILKPDAGSVRVLGDDLTGMSENQRDVFRGRHIGMLFQRFHLLPGLTVWENVALATGLSAKKLNWAKSKEMLSSLELDHKLMAKPGQLSIGQQQRVALARALVNRPALVLADEPTSSLDTRLALKAMELIRTRCRKDEATLIVVSHDAKLSEGFSVKMRLEDFNRVKQQGEGVS